MREEKTCSQGPLAGIEPGLLRSRWGLNGTHSTRRANSGTAVLNASERKLWIGISRTIIQSRVEERECVLSHLATNKYIKHVKGILRNGKS